MLKQVATCFCLLTLTCAVTSCKDSKGKAITYCPSSSKVAAAASNNEDYVSTPIGNWKLIKLSNADSYHFQKASYVAGWPACLYGPKDKNPSIELSPRVKPELFPAWEGTSGGTKQWNAPDCTGKTTDCPWKAVPWSAVKNQPTP